MVSMNAFYSDLFTTPSFASLLRIARANLKEILAVRSDLAWEVWS